MFDEGSRQSGHTQQRELQQQQQKWRHQATMKAILVSLSERQKLKKIPKLKKMRVRRGKKLQKPPLNILLSESAPL